MLLLDINAMILIKNAIKPQTLFTYDATDVSQTAAFIFLIRFLFLLTSLSITTHLSFTSVTLSLSHTVLISNDKITR